MIMISCPYWHEDKVVRDYRMDMANKYAAYLIGQGIPAFSPLSHSAMVLQELDDQDIDEKDLESVWLKIALRIIPCCNDIHVLMLPGWTESKGVDKERALANTLGIHVSCIEWP